MTLSTILLIVFLTPLALAGGYIALWSLIFLAALIYTALKG